MRTTTRMLLTGLTAILLAGCQSTSIRSAWYDPGFTVPMARIVVAGNVPGAAQRRVLEESFAQSLHDAGVEGVPGHTIIDDAAWNDEDAFNAALVRAGAQGLLVVQLLGVDTRTNVATTLAPAGRHGWHTGRWGGAGPWGPSVAPVANIQQYRLATVDTSLFDVQSGQLVWAATTQTFNPRSVQRETPAFASVIIGELKARGLIAGAPGRGP